MKRVNKNSLCKLGEKVYYLEVNNSNGYIEPRVKSFVLNKIENVTYLDKNNQQQWGTYYYSVEGNIYNAIGCFNTIERLVSFYRGIIKSVGYAYKENEEIKKIERE